MNIIIILVLTILSTQGQFNNSNVKILHLTNFTSITNIQLYKQSHGAKQNWLIMFYAPWCPHCKKLVPTFIQLSQTRDSIGALDWQFLIISTESKQICIKYGIRGYPTILYFVKGKGVYQYNKNRSLENLQKYMDQKLYLNKTPYNFTQDSLFTQFAKILQKNWVSYLNPITFLAIFISSIALLYLMTYCLCFKKQCKAQKKSEQINVEKTQSKIQKQAQKKIDESEKETKEAQPEEKIQQSKKDI